MKRGGRDSAKPLLGRGPDLAYLLERSGHKGVTAVVGRPQMGKSWLLQELADRLSRDPTGLPSILGQPPLVGSVESLGETADLLLRAVVDLYSGWLSDASYIEQAQVVYKQRKKDFVGKAGEAVGTIFEKLSKMGSKPMEAVAGLVKETFEGLASANRELLSGGLQLPRLQIEQGHDLLELVHGVAKRPLVLIFDQWEKSPGIELETNVLDSFVRHLEDWPPCHIFLGLRPDEKARHAVTRLQHGFPGAVKIYDLPPMHLADSDSKSELLQYIRGAVSAAAAASDDELLEMLSGYPGTLAQWTSEHYARQLASAEELKKVAADANAYRFAEFDELLPVLSDSQRVLSIRLALLPTSAGEENWKALKEIVLQEIHPRDLDGLKRSNILEATAPPSYGHAKRAEAARQWLLSNCLEELRQIGELLIFRIAEEIEDLSSRSLPYISSLIDMNNLAISLELSNVSRAFCASALSVSEIQVTNPECFVGIASQTRGMAARAAPLLAIGLFNALVDAKQEGALERRDALLKELQALAGAHLGDAAVREWLAKGLFNTLNDAKREKALERRDVLLKELQALAGAYPGDAAVREWLAKGLFNTLVDAKQEEALERRDALLKELRKLAGAYPSDAVVRERLAKGLFNTLVDAKQEEALERRDALLKELREQAGAYPGDAVVREWLAKGLFNTLNHATQEESLERRDELLDELRELIRAYPEDAVSKQISELIDSH